MTYGGQQWGNTGTISLNTVKKIKQEILNTNKTLTQIGKENGVSSYTISDINRGNTFRDKNLNYPLDKLQLVPKLMKII